LSDETHGVRTALRPRQRLGSKRRRNGLARMCAPRSSRFSVNFMPASIENFKAEGKQKACTPGGIPPCLPTLNGGVSRRFRMTSDALKFLSAQGLTNLRAARPCGFYACFSVS
jgi:hypothetical protein